MACIIKSFNAPALLRPHIFMLGFYVVENDQRGHKIVILWTLKKVIRRFKRRFAVLLLFSMPSFIAKLIDLKLTFLFASVIRFLKAASTGDNILVTATTDKVGKNLAFLSVRIAHKETGAILVQGTL